VAPHLSYTCADTNWLSSSHFPTESSTSFFPIKCYLHFVGVMSVMQNMLKSDPQMKAMMAAMMTNSSVGGVAPPKPPKREALDHLM